MPPLKEIELQPTLTMKVAEYWSRLRKHESFYALGCCGVLLACILIARPFSESGYIDDWTYAHLALSFARTGHVHYDGYTWALSLFHALWGGVLIRLFGFSFDLLRIATIPFSLAFVWLVYALGRKTGLRRDLAWFGALVVGTSPLFLPIAASFMTDAYGCFFTTLCLYAAVSAALATRRTSASLWLWTLLISGIIGGSDRQTVWVAPLALIPYLFWIRRSERPFVVQAIVAYIICLSALGSITVNFTPTYGAVDLSTSQLSELLTHNAVPGIARLISVLLVCLQVALPCLLCFAVLYRKLKPEILFGLLLASGFAVIALLWTVGTMGVAPFASSLLSRNGILQQGTDLLGYRPVLLSPLVRFCLSVGIVFSGLAFWLLRRAEPVPSGGIPRGLFLVFSCSYIVLLVPGAMTGLTHDRYALPLLPALVIAVLQSFQSRNIRIGWVPWACSIVLAVYATVITHDYANSLRARVQAAQLLEKTGVPRSQISAGLEYDGWTQLEMTGKIRGTRHDDAFEFNLTDRFWFWHFTDALRPEYVASYTPSSNQARNHRPAVNFISWAPPSVRSVVISRKQDLPASKPCIFLQPCSQ